MFDQQRLKAWTVAMRAWVHEQWPDQVASITLHVERESTPHAHVLIVPRVRGPKGWKLSSKALFNRATLREMQSSYARALAPLGIRRGEEGSEAKHSEVKQFYGAVFGWSFEDQDMGDMGTYTILKVGDASVGGMADISGRVPDEVPAHWLVYFTVEDTDGVVEKAKAGGGQVSFGPVDIPVGRFAIVVDPFGAVFAVMQPTEETMENAP